MMMTLKQWKIKFKPRIKLFEAQFIHYNNLRKGEMKIQLV